MLSAFRGAKVLRCAYPYRFASSIAAYASTESLGAGLIPVINRLQSVCATINSELDLPQIVVIGGQSSGKSSVLESLVGRDFLPRGTGICTRRPLVLQLIQHESEEEFGEFEHTTERFYDFHAIRKEIEQETDRITGKNKGVSPLPIILRVYSPKVLPLTLVDTPGMARVAVGDQPEDIEAQILKMVRGYISNPSSIILAVQPANQDLATSDALKLAREVDPSGMRTIGVLTKLDLMDAGTNALDILMGRLVPLKLGYVAVLNRSQRDIESGKSVGMHLKDEERFFSEHLVYRPIAKHCGVPHLAIKCNQLLTRHIKRALPELRLRVQHMLYDVEAELTGLGTGNFSSKEGQGAQLLQILSNVSKEFSLSIESQQNIDVTELHGGARVRYIFNEIFGRNLEAMRINLSPHDLRTAIKNAAGVRPSLFVPEEAFEVLIRKQIELLREPSIQCAEVVHNEMLRIVSTLDDRDLNRFPALREHVMEVSAGLLRKCLQPTRKMIENMIQCELAYINTAHPAFVDGTRLLSQKGGPEDSCDNVAHDRSSGSRKQTSSGFGPSSFFSSIFGGKASNNHDASTSDAPTFRQHLEEPPQTLRINPGEMSKRDEAQVRLIRSLLNSYFDIVRSNAQDFVPKIIMHFLVANAKDNLQRELVGRLYKEELYDALLSENPLVERRRSELVNKQQVLRAAEEILQVVDVRDIP